ncbi:30S ribosomal protein S13 [Candidatus Micrarchaeota archaeon]|nr:30S ribosomal protein S13 [Candidatus Micrarchaeota archaeon]
MADIPQSNGVPSKPVAQAPQPSSPVQARPAASPAGSAPSHPPQPISRPVSPSSQAPKPASDVGKETRGIVRILGKDLKGGVKLDRALGLVRGVGRNLARALSIVIQKALSISPATHVGDLTDKQILSIEELIRDPVKFGVPAFLLNRQKNRSSGRNSHLAQTDLQFAVRQDVELEKALRSWRGWRSSLNQRVRGQHNRTTGRTGMTVGVLKKAIKSQKAAAATSAQEKAPEKKAEKK